LGARGQLGRHDVSQGTRGRHADRGACADRAGPDFRTGIVMKQAYIVDALRTPTGRRKGGLAQVHAADLGGVVLKQPVAPIAIPADDYDDVIYGCVDTIGPLAGNIARTCWLAAGLPLTVPGVTVDRQCGSSQQAVHFAAQAVMSGTQDVVIAGGVQTMSQIPISAAMLAGQVYGQPDPFS